MQQVLYYVRDWKHLSPLWFSNVANQIMWWTYVKAFWRGVVSAFGTKITFKTTLKGTGRLAQKRAILQPQHSVKAALWRAM